MTAINVAKLFDISKTIGTQAGQQVQDFIQYTVQTMSQVVATLRNGISLGENVDCDVKVFTLTSDTAQVVSVSPGKTPTGMFVVRVGSKAVTLDAFNWWFDDSSKPTVQARLIGATSAPVTIVILYGKTV